MDKYNSNIPNNRKSKSVLPRSLEDLDAIQCEYSIVEYVNNYNSSNGITNLIISEAHHVNSDNSVITIMIIT